MKEGTRIIEGDVVILHTHPNTELEAAAKASIMDPTMLRDYVISGVKLVTEIDHEIVDAGGSTHPGIATEFTLQPKRDSIIPFTP